MIKIMTIDEQTFAFQDAIMAAVRYHNKEFDMNYATIVGVLEFVKHELIEECCLGDEKE